MYETQRELILSHLKKYGSITPLHALREYGVYRLSSIIHKLRKDGEHIETESIKHINKYGKPIHYAKYIYKEINVNVGESYGLAL